MLAAVTVHQFCVGGSFEPSILTVRAALAERASLLAAALRREIPGCRFHEPDGGYFLWVELPDDIDVDKLAPAATARGVAVVKGTDFLLEGGHHALRLAFSAVTADDVDEGVRRIAAAIADIRTA